MTKRRSAKFLGSEMWRNRDVSRSETLLQGDPAVRFTDRPTNSSIVARPAYGEARMLRELAHRVYQFE